MKKNILYLLALSMSLTFYPLTISAQSASATNALVSDPATGNPVMTRLNEIKNMDKSKLTVAEKKALRKEVRSIVRENQKLNTGVYLSVGAIIIILLLLVLLL